MRKNLAKHTAKKLPLAKRVLALCFALIFVCSCLLPAFANGTGEGLDTPGTEVVEAADPGTEPESMDLYDEPAALDDDFAVADEPAAMDDDFAVADEPAAMDDDFAMDDEPAAMDDQVEKPVVDDEPAAMDNEVEKPVEGGEPPVADDTPAAEGATKTTTDASGNIVYEYDTSGTTFPEDDAAALPDGDQMQVDAAFSIPTNIYHFWLKKMSDYDLADIADAAETAKMTVEQYLAMYGTDKGCYHIMTAADGANLKDYQFADPTSNDDPEGNSRTFAGWYYTDELGDEQKFVFDEHLYVSEGTTVEVYAKWKTIETSTEKSIEINGKTLKVKIDNLPGIEKIELASLSAIDEKDMEEAVSEKLDGEFYNFYAFDIAPLDENENRIEPSSGMASVSVEIPGLKATDSVRVFHELSANEVEDVAVSDGKVTFETDGFSPFMVATVRTGNAKYKAMHDKIMDCEEVDEIERLTQEYLEDNGFKQYLNGLSTEEQELFLRKINFDDGTISELEPSDGYEVMASDISLLAITPSRKPMITVGESITLTGATGSNHRWSAVPNPGVTITPVDYLNKNKVTVKSDNPGMLVIKHTYTVYYYGGSSERKEETITIQVTGNASDTKHGEAAFYYLKNSLCNPIKNQANQWGSCLGWGDVTLSNAVWKANDDSSGMGDKNIFNALVGTSTWIVSWPSGIGTPGTDEKGNYLSLTKDGTYWKEVVNAYNVKTDEITEIRLRPYKISENNTGTYYHVDCIIEVVMQHQIVATYWVKQPNGETFEWAEAHEYKLNHKGDPAQTRPEERYEPVKTVDGKVYKFDGWYYDKDCTNKVTEFPDTIYENKDYYAQYIPETASVTLTKHITGLMGDQSKKFTFSVNGGAPFTLGNNGSYQIRDVGIGDTLTIVEYDADGYTTSALITDANGNPVKNSDGEDWKFEASEGKESATKTITIKTEEGMVDEDGNLYISVINDRTATIDNGVLLDTLPYILILVVVAGGGVLLFLRKRKNDDDE